MFDTVTATVTRRRTSGEDDYGNPVYVDEMPDYANVIVDRPTTKDMDAARAYGATASLTLHWPIDYGHRLQGAIVHLPEPWGGPWRVIGDPLPLMAANNPMPYYTVLVEGAHG